MAKSSAIFLGKIGFDAEIEITSLKVRTYGFYSRVHTSENERVSAANE